jgi:hypothetical protein
MVGNIDILQSMAVNWVTDSARVGADSWSIVKPGATRLPIAGARWTD